MQYWNNCARLQSHDEGQASDKRSRVAVAVDGPESRESSSQARGRKLVGWDEILEGGLSPNATVMELAGHGRRHQGGQVGSRRRDVARRSRFTLITVSRHRQAASSPGFGSGVETLEEVYRYDPVSEGTFGERGAAPHPWRTSQSLVMCHEHPKKGSNSRPGLSAVAAASAEAAWCPDRRKGL